MMPEGWKHQEKLPANLLPNNIVLTTKYNDDAG